MKLPGEILSFKHLQHIRQMVSIPGTLFYFFQRSLIILQPSLSISLFISKTGFSSFLCSSTSGPQLSDTTSLCVSMLTINLVMFSSTPVLIMPLLKLNSSSLFFSLYSNFLIIFYSAFGKSSTLVYVVILSIMFIYLLRNCFLYLFFLLSSLRLLASSFSMFLLSNSAISTSCGWKAYSKNISFSSKASSYLSFCLN